MIEISLSNIQKTFGYNNILKNINFDIKTGDKVSLIGENGCGKTTILELIIGNEVIDSGNKAFSNNINFKSRRIVWAVFKSKITNVSIFHDVFFAF